MSNADSAPRLITLPEILPEIMRHLKTGDIFDIHPNKNVRLRLQMRGADIVHYHHSSTSNLNKNKFQNCLTFVTNYPFGRRNGDTPLRYVVYAELVQ